MLFFVPLKQHFAQMVPLVGLHVVLRTTLEQLHLARCEQRSSLCTRCALVLWHVHQCQSMLIDVDHAILNYFFGFWFVFWAAQLQYAMNLVKIPRKNDNPQALEVTSLDCAWKVRQSSGSWRRSATEFLILGRLLKWSRKSWGYPPVIIHSSIRFSILNHPAIGVHPWPWKPPNCCIGPFWDMEKHVFCWRVLSLQRFSNIFLATLCNCFLKVLTGEWTKHYILVKSFWNHTVSSFTSALCQGIISKS